MRADLSLAGIALCVVLATPVVAQSRYEHETGSHIFEPRQARIPDSKLSEADRGRITIIQFAQCTLDSDPRKVETILHMPLGPDYQKALARLVNNQDCLSSGEMKFQPSLLRGALFGEYWRRRVIAEQRGRTWAPVFDPIDVAAPPPDNAVAQNLFPLLLMADCLVNKDRASASDIVSAPPESATQKAAYGRVVPLLGACVPRGTTARLSKVVIEGAIAEVLYRSPDPVIPASIH